MRMGERTCARVGDDREGSKRCPLALRGNGGVTGGDGARCEVWRRVVLCGVAWYVRGGLTDGDSGVAMAPWVMGATYFCRA